MVAPDILSIPWVNFQYNLEVVLQLFRRVQEKIVTFPFRSVIRTPIAWLVSLSATHARNGGIATFIRTRLPTTGDNSTSSDCNALHIGL